MFNREKLENNPVKTCLKLHLKCLQNRILFYESIFSKQTYPKFKKQKMKIMILDKKSLIAHAKMRLVYILNLYTKNKYHHTLV